MSAAPTGGLDAWPEALRKELAANDRNGRVGTRLLSRSERVRVWSLALEPGERVPFHRHVLDYFYTALTPGRGRSRSSDRRISDFEFEAGDTEHLRFGPGESSVHDLENIGDARFAFTTVEFLDSANPPLDIPRQPGEPPG